MRCWGETEQGLRPSDQGHATNPTNANAYGGVTKQQKLFELRWMEIHVTSIATNAVAYGNVVFLRAFRRLRLGKPMFAY